MFLKQKKKKGRHSASAWPVQAFSYSAHTPSFVAVLWLRLCSPDRQVARAQRNSGQAQRENQQAGKAHALPAALYYSTVTLLAKLRG